MSSWCRLLCLPEIITDLNDISILTRVSLTVMNFSPSSTVFSASCCSALWNCSIIEFQPYFRSFELLWLDILVNLLVLAGKTAVYSLLSPVRLLPSGHNGFGVARFPTGHVDFRCTCIMARIIAVHRTSLVQVCHGVLARPLFVLITFCPHSKSISVMWLYRLIRTVMKYSPPHFIDCFVTKQMCSILGETFRQYQKI